MVERFGDVFDMSGQWMCVLTNGIVNGGIAVMGAGQARRARDTYPGIDVTLGQRIMKYGNHVSYLGMWRQPVNRMVLSFPTKHDWRENSDLDLIERSLKELHDHWYTFGDQDTRVLLPRPGCGKGKLDWATQVKPLVLKYLPEPNFVLVDFKRPDNGEV